MASSCCSSARSQRHTVLCFQIMCLVCWPLFSEAARLRCGSDLLSDLLFVCGDRGIYLGKGTWSGYGARPRGKGIVEQCCRPGGCELQHLEKYCAKPKSLQTTAAPPTTATAPPTTAMAPPTITTAPPTTATDSPTTTTAPPTTATDSPTTTTAPPTTATDSLTTTPTAQTTAQTDMAHEFEAVFHKRLLEHLGPPNSPKREAYRKKTQPSLRRSGKVSSSNRRRQESTSSRRFES